MLRHIAALALALPLVVGCSNPAAGTPSQSAVVVVPSDTPDPTPVPTATPLPLPVKMVDHAGTVAQSKFASLTIRTIKKSKCSIEVAYDTVVSEAAGLGSKTADAKGLVTWKWKVGSNTKPGVWPITVTCTLASREGRLGTSVTVK